MDAIHGDLQAEYEICGILSQEQIPFLHRSTFKDKADAFPEMSGRAIHMRRIVKPLLALLKTVKQKSRNYVNESRQFQQMAHHRIEMLTGLHDYYAIMHDEGRYMLGSSADRLLSAVERSLENYADLCDMALKKGDHNWHVTIKHHHFLHVADLARYENPRFSWTMNEEHNVGHVARVTKSVCHGTGGSRMTPGLMAKHLVSLFLNFKPTSAGHPFIKAKSHQQLQLTKRIQQLQELQLQAAPAALATGSSSAISTEHVGNLAARVTRLCPIRWRRSINNKRRTDRPSRFSVFRRTASGIWS